MQPIDWILLVVYLSGLVGIGVYFSRRQASMGNYLKGDGRVGWIAMGLSLMSALNSGMDYIQTPAIVFVFGMVYVSLVLTWIPIYPWVTCVTVPFYRRLNVTSAYEYLERRFDLTVRLIASTIFVLWRICWMGVALYIPCLAIQGSTNHQVEVAWMALALGLVVTTYTMLGGIEAVIWTDVVQSVVMFLGLATIFTIIVSRVPGGLEEVWNLAAESGRLSMATQLPDHADSGLLGQLSHYLTTEVTFWGTILFVLLGRMAMYTGDQVAVQRFQAIGSTRQAGKALIVSGIADVIWMTVLGFVGLSLFAYSQVDPFPPDLKNDSILPHFMSQHFTAGFTGLVVASILAASLSSVDAALNSTSSIIMVDFYHRAWRGRHGPITDAPASEQKHMLWVSRVVTTVLGILMSVIAASVEQLGEIYTIGNKLFGAFFGILFGIFLLGMFSRRASERGAICGAIAGLATSCFFSFFGQLHLLHGPLSATFGPEFTSFCSRLSWQWPPLFGIAVTLIVGLLVSRVCKRHVATPALTYWEVMRLPEPADTGSTHA